MRAGARQAAVDAFGRRCNARAVQRLQWARAAGRGVMLNCSALHRAAAAGGGRNRFDVDNLKEKDANEPAAVQQVLPTGAIIALLTRDDGALVDAFDHAGYTALHVAAAAADADAVAALCGAGARYDVLAANDGEDSEKGAGDLKQPRVEQHASTCT